jgi:hypothetical protein
MTTAIPPSVFAQITQTSSSPEDTAASLNAAEASYSRQPKHSNQKYVYPYWKTCQVCLQPFPCDNPTRALRNTTCGKTCAKTAMAQAPRKHKALPVCQWCGKTFKPKSRIAYSLAKTCGYKCRDALRVSRPGFREHMKEVGATGRAGWTEESRQSYLGKMTGAKNPAWKGGVTYMRKHGTYAPIKYVRCPPDFLPMARKDGYVMEHRLFVAQALGRCLLRTETVHHKNHDPQDNSLPNLELFANNQAHKLFEHHGSPAPLWSG